MRQRPATLARLLREPAFPLALGAAAVALLAWPLLTEPPRSPLVLYAFQFAVWALLIVVLWALSRQVGRGEGPGDEGGGGEQGGEGDG